MKRNIILNDDVLNNIVSFLPYKKQFLICKKYNRNITKKIKAKQIIIKIYRNYKTKKQRYINSILIILNELTLAQNNIFILQNQLNDLIQSNPYTNMDIVNNINTLSFYSFLDINMLDFQPNTDEYRSSIIMINYLINNILHRIN